jgi:excisionase family DNA binding protein
MPRFERTHELPHDVAPARARRGARGPAPAPFSPDQMDDLAHLIAELLAERLAGGTASSLIDATEAGQLLNVNASWVLAEARANRIPHVRLGKYVRFEPDELTAWWASKRR